MVRPFRSALMLLVALALLAAGSTAHAANAKRAGRGELKLVDPASVGMDAARLLRVDAAIERAIADGVTPGAALAVGRKGKLVRMRGYGRLDWDPAASPVDDRSIFDLASLTKSVATTSAIMFLVQDGKLDLDAPLSKYLGEFRGVADRRTMTARHLLTHTSGLPAGGPLAGLVTRAEVPSFMARVKLRWKPGARTEYSDYGMILLGALVERLAGEPLDLFVHRRLFEPLHLEDTRFNPFLQSFVAAQAVNTAPFDFLGGINALLARIAPTERTPKGHLHGVVHDPLAGRLGGVAGHAGLFSSAHDLAVFAQLLLDNGRTDEGRVFDAALVQRFTRPARKASRYALGWEIARPGGPAGEFFSPRAFGHTGFTGTSLWIDPERELFVVLLTNRVNPSASEKRHAALRRLVHDGVQQSLLPLSRVGEQS